MSTIYIEGFSGLSGDMFLAALAELTDSFDTLADLPIKLNLPDGKIEIEEVIKNGISCKHVNVIDLNQHSHHHSHSHGSGHHHGRHLKDIIEIIDNARINTKAKEIAKEIFQIIGKAESKIHNIPLGKIHFHEISGVDSIIDIVGSAVLISQLGITKTYSTAICTGHGFVNTQHGKLPVPAPATAEILSGIPIYPGDEKGERVTPTGAAILRFLNPNFNPPQLTLLKTAYGAGKKDFTAPNVLRISLVNENEKPEDIYTLETNIDDMPAEFLGKDFQLGLNNSGAIDYYFTPIQMKKSRPALLLSCLVTKSKLDTLSNYILEHTSTIGLRYFKVDRKILERKIEEFDTKYGKIKIKTVTTPSGKKRRSFEYEDLIAISKRENIPVTILQQELYSIL